MHSFQFRSPQPVEGGETLVFNNGLRGDAGVARLGTVSHKVKVAKEGILTYEAQRALLVEGPVLVPGAADVAAILHLSIKIQTSSGAVLAAGCGMIAEGNAAQIHLETTDGTAGALRARCLKLDAKAVEWWQTRSEESDHSKKIFARELGTTLAEAIMTESASLRI